MNASKQETIMNRSALALGLASALILGAATAHAASPPQPVYIHMNGANEFLERLVFVHPGQKVVFVNEDTGPHAILGYNPQTGAASKTFDDPALAGTPGKGHKLHTYAISFRHQGPQWYYCPVHAGLTKAPGGVWMPKVRPGVHGFGTPMAGVIIVTRDAALLKDNPATSHSKVLPGYFGG
ncbi:Cupredoxin [Acidiphilium sp. 20-67-58]|uniref:cupredoxin domain-containing protein n=2 Tax=unclassified Acidiphilium TaxID=2617493 RepID=UPI0025C50430|nr:Cupredoxin [Acidiphilium sp. 20-67-58]